MLPGNFEFDGMILHENSLVTKYCFKMADYKNKILGFFQDEFLQDAATLEDETLVSGKPTVY